MSSAARLLPALGWDPCPGDVAGCRALAGDLRALARRVRGGEADARADAPAWRGPAARGHRARVEALPTALGLVAASVDALAAAVEGWATALGRLQLRADEVERRMVVAREQVADASAAFALTARSSNVHDLVVGRPAGWTAHVATRARVERASTAQVAVEAAAQRLHGEYADAADAVARAMADAVDVGLRAPWQGAPPPGLTAADGGLVAPQRSTGTVLARSVWQDGYGEGVRRHADQVDAYADGSAAASLALELLPFAPTQVASRGAGVTSSLAAAHLEHFVAEDRAAALRRVGLAGTAVVGGASLRTGARGERRGADGTERAVATAVAAVPAPPVPDPWEVPGHLGTARRGGAEAAARTHEQRTAALARRRAEEVRRCTGG